MKVIGFLLKKTAAEKSYISALCKILALLNFRVSEEGPIKLMQQFLNRITESLAAERDIVKELKQLSERLKVIDKNPEEKLSSEQANLILGKGMFLFFMYLNPFRNRSCQIWRRLLRNITNSS